MRSDYPRRETSALVWLLAAVVAAYIIQFALVSPWFGASGRMLVNSLALTVPGLQAGHVWTLFTYGFLHSTGNPFHVLFTVLGLVFVGREVEPLLGRGRFLGVFAAAIILGALCWSAVHWTQGGIQTGAAAGVLGLFVVLACLYPDQKISFLVLFLFPITLRPKYFIVALLALNACTLIFFEIRGTVSPFDYAPSAHLGGMLAGWIYFRFLHANNGWDRTPSVAIPRLFRRAQAHQPASPSPAIDAKPAKSPANLRAEVDRILDKINSHGFSALTADEKRILDEAKDLLSRS